MAAHNTAGVTDSATAAGASPTATPAATARAGQKQRAESERARLQERLGALKKSIDTTETAKSRAADAVAKSDAAISDATRALHDLERDRAEAQAALAALTRQRDGLDASLAARRSQLAAVLRKHYVGGNGDRIALLLSGDDPAQISRQLRYLGYVGRAQTRLIADLKTAAAAVEVNQAEASAASADLDHIAAAAQAQKTRLQQEQAQHAALVASLSTDLARQRAETGRLLRDDNRLGGLVEQLGKLIEQQRLADAAARENRRRAQVEQQAKAMAKVQAEAKAAAQAQAKAQARADARARADTRKSGVAQSPKAVPPGAVASAGTPSVNPDAIDADEPPRTSGVLGAPGTVSAQNSKILRGNEPEPEPRVQGVTSFQDFALLRGRMPLPVKGELTARFGAPREGGPGAKGIFIRAAEGAAVHAVAAGRVVFADWLRGFGNLIILDHGGQYLTVYGNNQAVLKHPGDSVGAGDIIAAAGSTGGNEQSGLYFEMRYQGRAIDPLGWTARVTSR